MRKKQLAVGILLAFLGTGMSASASENVDLELIIDHQLYVQTEQQTGPMLLDARVYVPLRLIGETLGYQVSWSESKRQVHIETDTIAQTNLNDSTDDAIVVPEDTPIGIFVDGNELAADETTGRPFLSEKGQTMVPLRLVGEALHCKVEWIDGVVIVEKLPSVAEIVSENGSESVSETTEAVQEYRYANLTIQGSSVATAEELQAMLDQKEPEIRRMMETQYPELGFTQFPRDIVKLYLEIGDQYHIRGDLAFAQALKETGYFQFYGKVQAYQNNFCGLGCSGILNSGEEALNGVSPDKAAYVPDTHGVSFATVADGVEAHIQHLYAYATTEPLPDGCELVDPRFSYVKRGAAKTWTDLNGRWAVPGNGYGESIIDSYWLPAMEHRLDAMQ